MQSGLFAGAHKPAPVGPRCCAALVWAERQLGPTGTGFRGSLGIALLGILALIGLNVAWAQEIDTSSLPPPALVEVDFVRDIEPILKVCLQCHGPERPKSKFRLDNREDALKGGKYGPDIIPGDSAKSSLIHNVAGLDPDMLMPPEGKGEPLTRAQIRLLRAWIDQGAK